jgi:hypothetical protein
MTMHWIIFLGQIVMSSPVHAQGSAYCAQFSDGSSADCGFSSLQMCEQSVTGVGGVCIMDPSGSGAVPSANTQNQMPFNASAMPPPPFAQQSSGPLQLPGPSQSQASSPMPPQPCNPLIDGTYCASANAGAPIASLSSDLALGGDPPATLGAITFSSGHNACIGLFGRSSCGGS